MNGYYKGFIGGGDNSPLPELTAEEKEVLHRVYEKMERIVDEDPQARVIFVCCPHCGHEMQHLVDAYPDQEFDA